MRKRARKKTLRLKTLVYKLKGCMQKKVIRRKVVLNIVMCVHERNKNMRKRESVKTYYIYIYIVIKQTAKQK